MSEDPKTEEFDSIFIIYAGLHGRYEDLKIAFEYEERAIQWCRDELAVVSSRPAFTEFPNDSTWELAMWLPDQQRKIGYTGLKKPLTLVGSMHVPDDGSQIHAVCDVKTLEVSYIGTDYGKASEARNRMEGAFVKSIEFRKGGSRIIPTVFTYSTPADDPSRAISRVIVHAQEIAQDVE
ncbi:MAG: hypothetical protein Q9222_000087 [Ikaeria aurantiellina]